MFSSNPNYNPNYNVDLSAKGETPANSNHSLNAAEPIVWGTSLVSLRNEPTKEDKDNFWSDAAPDVGTRYCNGCLRGISPFYTVYYLVMCILIVLFVVAITISTSNPGLREGLFMLPFLFTFFFPVSLLVWVVGAFYMSTTFRYLRNISTSESAGEFLDSLCQAKPTITVTVICSHDETHCTTDNDGKSTTHTRNVVAFRQEYPIALAAYEDATEPTDSKELTENQMTKIKVTQSFVADQNYDDMKKAWFEEHKNRDHKIDLVETMELPGFRTHVLAMVDPDSKPRMLGSKVFLLSHVLVFPALPYRLWLNSITGKVRVEIRKKILTLGGADAV